MRRPIVVLPVAGGSGEDEPAPAETPAETQQTPARDDAPAQQPEQGGGDPPWVTRLTGFLDRQEAREQEMEKRRKDREKAQTAPSETSLQSRSPGQSAAPSKPRSAAPAARVRTGSQPGKETEAVTLRTEAPGDDSDEQEPTPATRQKRRKTLRLWGRKG